MLRLAGPVAEAKLFGTPMRSYSCESDLTSAMRLCTLLDEYRKHLTATRALVVQGEVPGDLAARLRRRTRHVLAHPPTWRVARALVEDLDVWSRLTACDAADTVRWTRRIEGQLSLVLLVPAQSGAGMRRRLALSRRCSVGPFSFRSSHLPYDPTRTAVAVCRDEYGN